jgi:hypothetical protein
MLLAVLHRGTVHDIAKHLAEVGNALPAVLLDEIAGILDSKERLMIPACPDRARLRILQLGLTQIQQDLIDLDPHLRFRERGLPEIDLQAFFHLLYEKDPRRGIRTANKVQLRQFPVAEAQICTAAQKVRTELENNMSFLRGRDGLVQLRRPDQQDIPALQG